MDLLIGVADVVATLSRIVGQTGQIVIINIAMNLIKILFMLVLSLFKSQK